MKDLRSHRQPRLETIVLWSLKICILETLQLIKYDLFLKGIGFKLINYVTITIPFHFFYYTLLI